MIDHRGRNKEEGIGQLLHRYEYLLIYIAAVVTFTLLIALLGG